MTISNVQCLERRGIVSEWLLPVWWNIDLLNFGLGVNFWSCAQRMGKVQSKGIWY